LAEKLGTAKDPFAKIEVLEGKFSSGERSIQLLNRMIEELKKKLNTSNNAGVADLLKKVEGQGKEIAKLTEAAAISKRDRDRNRNEAWHRRRIL
jgi:hypothetical protein